MHCSHVGPHLGTLVPMGTKMSFLVPIFSISVIKDASEVSETTI